MKRMMLVLAIAGFTTPACGLLGGDGGMGMPGASWYGYGPEKSKELTVQTTVDVPPDRATTGVALHGHGSSFENAQSVMRRELDRVAKLAGATCEVKTVHYTTPVKDGDRWHSHAQVSVEAVLKGAADVRGRMDAMDACFGPLEALLLANPKYDGGAPEGFEMEGAEGYTLVVDDPAASRAGLVTLANDRMKAVAAGGAAQWAHDEVECTSVGFVTAISRTLSAITLGLEVRCFTPFPVDVDPNK